MGTDRKALAGAPFRTPFLVVSAAEPLLLSRNKGARPFLWQGEGLPMGRPLAAPGFVLLAKLLWCGNRPLSCQRFRDNRLRRMRKERKSVKESAGDGGAVGESLLGPFFGRGEWPTFTGVGNGPRSPLPPKNRHKWVPHTILVWRKPAAPGPDW